MTQLTLLASNSVLLPGSPVPGVRSRANSFLARSLPASRSNSISGPHPGHPILDSSSLSPDRAVLGLNGPEAPVAAIPTNILNPVDTQAAQIRHMIAAAHAEREHLQSQIKEARRASQRAEAALRSEIESVKRAIDKAGSMDLRAKQKALALQEQVKQGWAGAEHAERQAEQVKNGQEDLRNRYGDVKIDVDSADAEYKAAKAAEDEVRERDRKARQEEDKKLAEVVGKIDKLKIRKDKKEAEKAELEARLDELERQREHEERRTVEEKYARRSSAYWWDPHVQNHGHGHGHGHGHHHDHHPRGGRGFARNVSHPAWAVPPAQPSPTASSFQPNTASPAFVPDTVSGSPAPSNRAPSAAGVNVSATPFKPAETAQHTTLMPPQLQHRIYLPSERPRPAPTFNPPPSVMAEQRQSPTPSSPTFSSPDSSAAAPSLASIVTRAVLSPTSVLSGQANPAPPRASPPLSGPNRYISQPSPVSAGLWTSNPASPSPHPASNHSSGHSSRQTTFGPPPDRSEQSPTSPSGPWGPQSKTGLPRTATPPTGTFRSGAGRQSPMSPASTGSGSGKG